MAGPQTEQRIQTISRSALEVARQVKLVEQLQESLRAEIARWQAAVSVSQDAFIVAAANGEGRPIEFANPVADELYGEKLEGLPLISIVPLADRPKHLEGIKRLGEPGRTYLGKTEHRRLLRADGSTVPVTLTVFGDRDARGEWRFIGCIRRERG